MRVLSPRLKMLSDFLIEGSDVWDLCCDHGYLGEAALESGLFPRVHFVDRVPDIIERLRSRLNDRLDVSKHAVFYSVDAGEISEPLEGTVVLAGVGADRIRQIIGDLLRRQLLHAKRILICPQTKEESVGERYAFEIGLSDWKVSRYEVMEGSRRRVIFVWDRETSLPALPTHQP